MEIRGETVINAARGSVWNALNDPDLLARCIEGVERLDRVGENRFEGVLNAKVGPVKAKFTGGVELTELDPPNRYVLVGEGKGGVAGFAKGSADVTLTDAPGGGTLLSYTARSQVGGKLAQLGTRLVEGAAKGYAESFFAAFKAEVEAPPAAAADAAPESAPSAADVRAAAVSAAVAATSQSRGLPGWVWIGGLVLIVLAVLALLF
jgi:carbon monoxide dehydrogenase subunit G